MSTSSFFTLITNDGKQDKLLLASRLLRTRLDGIKRQLKLRNPTVTAPIPSLSEIEKTHILFVNSHYKPYVAIAFEYQKVSAMGGAQFGGCPEFDIPQFGEFFADMAVHIRFGELTAPVTDPVLGLRYNYCDYPGVRTLKEPKFMVNGQALDQYSRDDYAIRSEYIVTPEKRRAYDRAVGQETDEDAYIYQVETQSKEVRAYRNGPQTWKRVQPAFDMWVPLMFWFNRDFRLSISSSAILAGQRKITIRMADVREILQAVNVTAVPGGGFSVSQTTLPENVRPVIEKMELYINNIFVNPEIADIYVNRIGFNLIRVHRTEKQRLNIASGRIPLMNLKFPVETMYFGFRPVENVNNFETWHRFTNTELLNYFSPVVTTGNTLISRNVQARQYSPVVSKIGFVAHGIDFYREVEESFFSTYLPYTYGQNRVVSPNDNGKYMLNFNLYPEHFQASGYLNTSRAREIFLNYESEYISSNNVVEFIMTALALNFLIIADGSANLRYAT